MNIKNLIQTLDNINSADNTKDITTLNESASGGASSAGGFAPVESSIGLQRRVNKSDTKPSTKPSTKVKVDEEEINEEDLLVHPGTVKNKAGFTPRSQMRADHEVQMATSDLLQCGKNAEIIYNILRGVSEEQGIPGWVQEKITKSADYLNTVAEYMEGEYARYAEQNHLKDGSPRGGYGVVAGGTTMETMDEGQPIYHGADKPAQPWAAIDRIAGGKTNVAEHYARWDGIGFDIRSDHLWPAYFMDTKNLFENSKVTSWLSNERENQREPKKGAQCVLAIIVYTGKEILVLHGDAQYIGQTPTHYILKNNTGTHQYSKTDQIVFDSPEAFEQFATMMALKFGDDKTNIDIRRQDVMEAYDPLQQAKQAVIAETIDEAVSPAQQAAIAINMKKQGVKPKSKVKEGDGEPPVTQLPYMGRKPGFWVLKLKNGGYLEANRELKRFDNEQDAKRAQQKYGGTVIAYDVKDNIMATPKQIQGKAPLRLFDEQHVAEETITEKAKSKQQQKFFGMVRAIQKGEKVKGASPELKKAAKSISKGDVKDFAKTKHRGLPTKVDESVENDDVNLFGYALSKTLEESVDRLLGSVLTPPLPTLKEDVSVTPGGVGGSTKMFLNDEEQPPEPRIRKYTKERADGSVMTRWEVLDYRGHRASGQGIEGFDDLQNAKDFLKANRKKLSAPPSVDATELNENLRDWFKEKWVRFGPDGKIRGDCARGDDSEGKPKCLPQKKAQALGKKGRASAAARKRREDPNPERSGKAINVNTKKKKADEGITEKSLKEIGYSDHLDSSNFPQSKIIQMSKVDGQIEGQDVYTVSSGNQTVYFLKDGEGMSAFIGFENGNLKNIKNFTGSAGVVRALIGYIVHIKKNPIKISPNEPLTSDGLKWVTGLINSPRGLKIADRDGNSIDVESLKKEWLSARSTGKSGSTEIIISEDIEFGNKLRINEELRNSNSLLMPYNFYGAKKLDEPKKTAKEDVQHQQCPECGGPSYGDEMIAEEKDACYHKVKSRYRVWPSAYASGALSKCRKVGAKNWGNKSKK